jgi:nucleoside phosphorylase
MKPRTRNEFEIAVICALPLEADAVHATFDVVYNASNYCNHSGDTNAYSAGQIAHHNVVLVHMPGIGKVSAATVAANLTASFPGIQLAVVVGICGGIPVIDHEEVILGDVVISDGVVQYDSGRQFTDKFVQKNTPRDLLGQPNLKIRSLLAKLRTREARQALQTKISQNLGPIHEKLDGRSTYPGVSRDKLFKPTYRHKHYVVSCVTCANCKESLDPVCDVALQSPCKTLGCDEESLECVISRDRLTSVLAKNSPPQPRIHIGLIASGDTVMKSASRRDEIVANENVIAFEMEGAGVWDNIPCIVIKGICDYADSHKSKGWQHYAAATAAACTKAFLEDWKTGTQDGTHDLQSLCKTWLICNRNPKTATKSGAANLLRPLHTGS